MKGKQLHKLKDFLDAIDKEQIFVLDKKTFRLSYGIQKDGLSFGDTEGWLSKNWKAKQSLEGLVGYYKLPKQLSKVVKYSILSEETKDSLDKLLIEPLRITSKYNLPNSDECLDQSYEEPEEGYTEVVPFINDANITSLIDDKDEYPVLIEVGGYCTETEFFEYLQKGEVWKKQIKPILEQASRVANPISKAGRYCRDRIYREEILKSTARGEKPRPKSSIDRINSICGYNTITEKDGGREFREIRDQKWLILLKN